MCVSEPEQLIFRPTQPALGGLAGETTHTHARLPAQMSGVLYTPQSRARVTRSVCAQALSSKHVINCLDQTQALTINFPNNDRSMLRVRRKTSVFFQRLLFMADQTIKTIFCLPNISMSAAPCSVVTIHRSID